MSGIDLIIENKWNEFHAQDSRQALTGTSLDGYCRRLGLSIVRFDPGVRILEIGVGLGIATKQMHDRGCIVSALDICDRALERVKPYVDAHYLHRGVDQLPSAHFDLAISHLVTQHMSESDIRSQFPHVIRSLADDGRFVVQWAGSHREGENNDSRTILGGYGGDGVGIFNGRMVRDEGYAVGLIQQCGGMVVDVRCRTEFPRYDSYWFVTEVAR